ncbi:zinc finger, C3HC4 type (RING finger) protein [Senna tora]|uniref:Zinc finger, C3HC4 type (RING finger) protein n=1 Tax=Senna tora TaxID=362788 RepID=A0A835CL80_9FABA|nr:zinc finger, C3HC4 type (RING finger) protein [Senna tora]
MPAADSHRESLAGLSLDDVLANRAASGNQLATRRTLLDIIREDESINKKDRKSWKAFKDKLRLKRAGSAWTSSILIPTSDISIPLQNNRTLFSQLPRRSSLRVITFPSSDVATHYMADSPRKDEVVKGSDDSNSAAPTITRQGSTRLIGDASLDDKLKPQMSRPNSARLAAAVRADSIRRERVVTFRDSNDSDDEDDDVRSLRSKADQRQMSAREAVAAQEAAEAAAAAAAEDEEEDEEDDDEEGNGGGAVTMSLMDLLEETDRQMGLEGSRYRMEDDDDEIDDDEDWDEEDEGALEYDCCVCMVKHRGSAFVPCGHAFCRMCSRELTVTKGNCPLCNNFILEILEIF